ncbi:MAG: cob(I)yrinic acid a,c-diamide adenosyltransferase [Halobacteriaceae archaeon]
MTLYTGRGDDGDTDLLDRSRVSKASPRIEASGTVDELNALIGRARPTGYADIDDQLHAVQNHLHIIGAQLANPDPGGDTPTVGSDHVETLEDWMDDHDEELEPLEAFILPGGGDAGARLHHARTVCRRAERRIVALAAEDEVDETVQVYVNRLSDLLFAVARLANQREDVPEESPTY